MDTCFITKSFGIATEKLFEALKKMAGGKEAQRMVFVITELVLYELKDSSTNVLQAKNRDFLEKMSEEGFCLLVLKEETVCENVRPFMNYSVKKWNEIFTTLIHDNVANLSFNQLVRTDKRMPYFGFSESGYLVPEERNFIEDIVVYLKNAKKSKDSMAEELICTSLFCIFELIRGSERSEYILCTHDFRAVARLNKAIQTSYPVMQNQFKSINLFTMIQYMIREEILTSKEESICALKKAMGDNVKLIIGDDLPFAAVEKRITIEDAVERIFNNEPMELVGRTEDI